MPRANEQERLVTFAGRDPLHMFILETFASTGKSPSLEQIRQRFELATTQDAEAHVTTLERTGAIHRDPDDTAITHAYPFSNGVTAHRVQLASGVQAHAMCAIDALGMPFMLGQDADVASSCHECGSAVTVRVAGGAVQGYSPQETVVWLADRQEGCVAATDLCPDLNFFCSSNHLEDWRGRVNAKGSQLSMAEAVARGREVFERLMRK